MSGETPQPLPYCWGWDSTPDLLSTLEELQLKGPISWLSPGTHGRMWGGLLSWQS